MAKQYELMIDPTPRGWMYGFPKALPEEAVGGKGADLFVLTSFDLEKWLVEEGYPAEFIGYWRLWPQELSDEKMGDMKFTTAGDFIDEQNKFTQRQWDRVVGYGKVPEAQSKEKDYYYPGSDPQE